MYNYRWGLFLMTVFAMLGCKEPGSGQTDECTGSEIECGGSCVDPGSDPQHCGGCNAPCAADETCEAGSCEPMDPIDPPTSACTPPIDLEDTSAPDHVVGTGDVGSCTHAALDAAVTQGGVITFDCVFRNNPGTPGTLPGSGNVQWPQLRNGTNDIPDNPCTPNITWADADLGVLGDHGGPTPTMVPPAGSPALGLGDNYPPYDQRGEPRPATGCAAGAVEP